MEVAVLIRGVADPKWPLPQAPSLDSLQAHGARYGALSPFDEAALEVALSLRDANASARITALVAGDEALARKVAGWRPDALHRLVLDGVAGWDGDAVARALVQAVAGLVAEAGLVLIGREFGDFDDGSVPASLARLAGLPLCPLTLSIAAGADGPTAVRQGSDGLERLRLSGRTLVSVTNDPGNRLRHPLMKNVMLARKMPIPAWSPGEAPAGPAARLHLDAVGPAPAPERSGTCRWLEGSVDDKARALARVLAEAARV